VVKKILHLNFCSKEALEMKEDEINVNKISLYKNSQKSQKNRKTEKQNL